MFTMQIALLRKHFAVFVLCHASDRTWLDQVDFIFVLDAGIKDG